MASNTIVIKKGATYRHMLRWESTLRAYAPITGITRAGPCVITAPAHGMPNGWRIDRITSVVGMKQINTHQLIAGQFARTNFGRQFPNGFPASVVDANTLRIQNLNSSEFAAYVSGGVVEYNTPIVLAGYTARMQIRASVDSASPLLSLTSEANDIVIDDITKTILIQIPATTTAGLTFRYGVASLEMEDSGGIVTHLIDSAPVVVRETDITR